MRLTSKFLSDFEMREGLLDGAAGDSAVTFDDPSFKGKDFFCKTERRAYVVRLSDCVLYPSGSLKAPRELLATPAPPPFDRRGGHLIVTRDGHVTCGSVLRDSSLPGDVTIGEDGSWDLPLPQVVDEIEEPVVFAELLCAQFGHALIDTPARLWYRLEPSLEHLKSLKLVGFGTHGLGKGTSSEWPGYVTAILRGIGIDPQDIRIIQKPTRIRSLAIPKRLSPYGSNYGWSSRYLDVTTAIGDALTSGGPSDGQIGAAVRRWSPALSKLGFPVSTREMGRRPTDIPATKRFAYLSRSRLDPSKRGLMENQEILVEDVFRRLGFEIVHPQLLPLEEQVRTVRGASHVAGCVGSQMHLLALSRNAGKHVFRIAPSFFDTGFDKHIVEMGGGSYSRFVVQRPVPTDTLPSQQPWQLSPDDMTDLRQDVEGWLSSTMP